MQTNNLSKYARCSTAELEQLLSKLSDQSEVNSVFAELRKRYQSHYSRLDGHSDTPSSNTSSRSKFKATTQSKPEPPHYDKSRGVAQQAVRQSLIEAIQGLRYCLILLLAALFPIWIIRILFHPILTLSKVVRLVLAILAILIILTISIIVLPLKLLLLLITLGEINLFEELLISKFKDLYVWVSPNGFWKD